MSINSHWLLEGSSPLPQYPATEICGFAMQSGSSWCNIMFERSRILKAIHLFPESPLQVYNGYIHTRWEYDWSFPHVVHHAMSDSRNKPMGSLVLCYKGGNDCQPANRSWPEVYRDPSPVNCSPWPSPGSKHYFSHLDYIYIKCSYHRHNHSHKKRRNQQQNELKLNHYEKVEVINIIGKSQKLQSYFWELMVVREGKIRTPMARMLHLRLPTLNISW